MPDQGLFGAPVGYIAYDQNQLTNAKTLETLGDVAMQPAKKRLIEAQAGKLEHEAAFEKLMQQSQATLGQTAGGKPTSMADSFDSLARIAAGSGFITKAEELSKTSALLRTREAATIKSNVDTQLGQIKKVRENAELTAQLLGGVNDQESWARANALYTFQTGQPSQFANMPYSPDLVERLNKAALSAKERADLEEKRLTRKATEAYRESRLEQIDDQNWLRGERLRLAQEKEERLAKSGGGKGVSSPTKSELDQVARLIKKDFAGLEDSDMNDAAFSIAADARALRRANPAIDPASALQQAYGAAKDAGDFANLPRTVAGVEIPNTSKPTYQGRGKNAALPIVIPAGSAGAEALAKVPEGRYVRSSTGQMGIRTKNGVRPLSPDNSRLSAGAVDDDPDGADDEDNE